MVRAVFLDRDGVINANMERGGRPVAPTSLEQFRLLPGVPEAVERLKRAGFKVIVITNQPDIATGRTARDTVDAMHSALRSAVPVDDIKICVHVDADECSCRKPKPGMILQAANELGIDLSQSYVIGDRWRDVQAGQRAGCSTILVECGFEQDGECRPDKAVPSLPEAVSYILSREQAGETR